MSKTLIPVTFNVGGATINELTVILAVLPTDIQTSDPVNVEEYEGNWAMMVWTKGNPGHGGTPMVLQPFIRGTGNFAALSAVLLDAMAVPVSDGVEIVTVLQPLIASSVLNTIAYDSVFDIMLGFRGIDAVSQLVKAWIIAGKED